MRYYITLKFTLIKAFHNFHCLELVSQSIRQ
jgi:hypothetical protein